MKTTPILLASTIRAGACLLVLMSIMTLSGCMSSHYSDQRELFLASPEGKHYTLFETSGHELELQEERSFSRAVIAVGVVKEQFGSDSNVVEFIDRQIEHMRHYHDLVMEEQKKVTDMIGARDRLFRFIYDDDQNEYESGILMLRDGKIVIKSIE